MNFLHILRKFVFIFLAFTGSISLGNDLYSARYQEIGLPHIQNCLPITYTYINHFNSLVHGPDGFIYIGARGSVSRTRTRSGRCSAMGEAFRHRRRLPRQRTGCANRSSRACWHRTWRRSCGDSGHTATGPSRMIHSWSDRQLLDDPLVVPWPNHRHKYCPGHRISD